jgi:hypothetical protein
MRESPRRLAERLRQLAADGIITLDEINRVDAPLNELERFIVDNGDGDDDWDDSLWLLLDGKRRSHGREEVSDAARMCGVPASLIAGLLALADDGTLDSENDALLIRRFLEFGWDTPTFEDAVAETIYFAPELTPEECSDRLKRLRPFLDVVHREMLNLLRQRLVV